MSPALLVLLLLLVTSTTCNDHCDKSKMAQTSDTKVTKGAGKVATPTPQPRACACADCLFNHISDVG